MLKFRPKLAEIGRFQNPQLKNQKFQKNFLRSKNEKNFLKSPKNAKNMSCLKSHFRALNIYRGREIAIFRFEAFLGLLRVQNSKKKIEILCASFLIFFTKTVKISKKMV